MHFPLLVRRLLALLLPAGILFASAAGLTMQRVFADTASFPVISEVMWPGSDISTSDEWVEITCVGTGACDLSGWSFTSLKSTGEEGTIIVFPAGSVIAAGEVRIIGHYAASSSRLVADPWLITSSLSLPNTKLLLRLRDASGAVRDEADDGTGNPLAGANPSGGAKASMERIDLALAGNLASNWRTATESLGFKTGPDIFGTPGVIPSASSSSESSSSSRVEDPRSSSSEISSSSDSSVSFSSSSSESSVSSSSSEASSVSSSEESSASSDSSDSSSEVSSSESSVSSDSSASSVSSSETSSSSSSEASSSSSDFSSSSVSSTQRVVDPLSFAEILITEVLANPVGADTDEWIEVGNLGSEPVDIAGWKLDDGNSTAVHVIPPRTGSGFLLVPGEYVSFRKSVTGLPLDNTGERVSLMNGATLIDAWMYAETAEGVSYGRDFSTPSIFHSFCVPTENRPNFVFPLEARIVIQSAGDADVGALAVTGTDHVSLNLTAEAGGSLASAQCIFDYGDDTVLQSCNPPSHTFDEPGTYPVRLTVYDFCGGLSVHTITVYVMPEEETEESSRSSVRSSSSSRSSASSVSSSSSLMLMSMAVPVSFERGVIISEVHSVPIRSSAPLSLILNPSPNFPPPFIPLPRFSPTLPSPEGGGSTHEALLPPSGEGQGIGESMGMGRVGENFGEETLLYEEWIELFNPLDYGISLGGWTLDDVKDGGSKPWVVPANTVIRAGEYLVFPKSATKLQLNDDGDEVWLIAPDGLSSEHVTVPSLKAGTSFSLVDDVWCMSPISPGAENSCLTESAKSASSTKKTSSKKPSPFKVKYVTDLPETESGMSLAEVPEDLQSLVVTGGEIQTGATETGHSRFPELLLLTGGLAASVGLVGRTVRRNARK